MKDHDTNLATKNAELDIEAPADPVGDDFDAARVFADPVGYLESLGLRSELAGVHYNEIPAAA